MEVNQPHVLFSISVRWNSLFSCWLLYFVSAPQDVGVEITASLQFCDRIMGVFGVFQQDSCYWGFGFHFLDRNHVNESFGITPLFVYDFEYSR
jgi:hypothetical protein